jgi:hypothetical protein
MFKKFVELNWYMGLYGFIVGFIISAIGYPLYTWEFWIISIPLLIVGIIIEDKYIKRRND